MPGYSDVVGTARPDQLVPGYLAPFTKPGGLTLPALSVQMSMLSSSSSFWAPSDWVDVTNRIRTLSVTRGRQHELQRYEAGAVALTVTNQNGDFSPWNANGPWYGALGPAQGLKVIATWNGVSYPLFTGWINTDNPDYGLQRADMGMKGTDVLHVLANQMAQLPTATYVSGYGTATITINAFPAYAATSGTVQIPDSTGAYQSVTYTGVSGNTLTGCSSPGGSLPSTPPPVYFPYAQAYSGQLVAAILAVSGVPPSALGTIDAGTVLCQAPSITPGTTSLLSVLQQVEMTEQGHLYATPDGLLQFREQTYPFTSTTSVSPQGLITSNPVPPGPSGGLWPCPPLKGSLVPAPDDLDLFNDIPVTPQGGVMQEATDSASISTFGRRTYQGLNGTLHANPSDALALAQYLLARYHLPVTRVRSASLDNTADKGGNFPTMLGMDLLYGMSVYWQPLDGSDSPFTQTSLVEKITHTANAKAATWTTNFGLSPAWSGSFLTLDNPTLGQLDVQRLGP